MGQKKPPMLSAVFFMPNNHINQHQAQRLSVSGKYQKSICLKLLAIYCKQFIEQQLSHLRH
jgi:hypothetical protein